MKVKYDELKSALDKKASGNYFRKLKLRVKQLEHERVNAKQDEVALEAYSKRLNLLVHGIDRLTLCVPGVGGKFAPFLSYFNITPKLKKFYFDAP